MARPTIATRPASFAPRSPATPSASITPIGCCIRCAAREPRDRANSSASAGTTALDLTAEALLGGRAAAWLGGGVALLLCRHHGPGDARWHQSPAPCQALFGHVRHHLHDLGLDRLHRRHRSPGRSRPARDGQVRSGRDLGHQSRQYPNQRDDARHARPQGAGRQDRGRRCLSERHHAAGRSRLVPAAWHRWRARLCGHARAVPRRLCQLALPREIHRLPP